MRLYSTYLKSSNLCKSIVIHNLIGWIRAMLSLKIILGSLNPESFILLSVSKLSIKHNFKVIKIKNKNLRGKFQITKST